MKFLNPHPVVISESLIQGPLGTQDLTSIGSKTILGPIMDPAGLLKGPHNF